ncbi:MAG: hypothetical protein AAGD86_04630, partial [Pseudomonadota bacterium]
LAGAVNRAGVGLAGLVRQGEALTGSPLDWPPYALFDAETPIVNLSDAGAGEAVLSHAAGVLTGSDVRVLASDVFRRPVAGWRPCGDGRLALTLVTDSYALVTAGQAPAHARYWQRLVDGVRKARVEPGFSVAPLRPRRDWRLQLCVWGKAAAGAPASFDGEALPLAAEVLAPGKRCGYAWPARSGWHRVETAGTTRDVYVFPPDAWQTADHLERSAATELAAQRPFSGASAGESPRGPLPRWWFFVALLIATSLAWQEQKRAGA